jgi:cold shock CspA family protein
MESRADYRYEAYTTSEVREIRIPQQEWAGGAPPVGANGLPVAHGVVRWFDLNTGIGIIARDGTGDEVFFHFTALPGQGYRTLRAGTHVKFELVESSHGLTARNIQPKSVP